MSTNRHFTCLCVINRNILISECYALKALKHVVSRRLQSLIPDTRQLVPLKVFTFASFCRVSDAKMTMHIPYGLGVHYLLVMIRGLFLKRSSAPKQLEFVLGLCPCTNSDTENTPRLSLTA